MGCKIHLLIGSLFNVQRAGNVLMSYNNFPVKKSIPFFEQFDPDNTINFEFTPSPLETNEIIQTSYQIRRNLLIQFNNDTIDQTPDLTPILIERFPNMVATLNLTGNHLTPLGQDLDWQFTEGFSPLDTFGQWLKQGLSKDLKGLKTEICRWLNPADFAVPRA